MSKSEKRQKQAYFKFRCTEAERAVLHEKGKAAGLGASEFVRRAAFGRRIVTRTDTKLQAQLLQTAGLLKHLYNQMRDDHMNTALSLQFSETLRELKKAVIALDLDAVPVGE